MENPTTEELSFSEGFQVEAIQRTTSELIFFLKYTVTGMSYRVCQQLQFNILKDNIMFFIHLWLHLTLQTKPLYMYPILCSALLYFSLFSSWLESLRNLSNCSMSKHFPGIYSKTHSGYSSSALHQNLVSSCWGFFFLNPPPPKCTIRNWIENT